jgi:hypothetical protein
MNTVISGLYAAEPEPLGFGPSAGIHDHESREQYHLGWYHYERIQKYDENNQC